MQCVNVKVIFKKEAVSAHLSVTLILPFQQTKCFIKKIKKKFYKKKI